MALSKADFTPWVQESPQVRFSTGAFRFFSNDSLGSPSQQRQGDDELSQLL